MTEPPKDRIGAYRLVRHLGSGGMGEVFLAWDDRLERPVAAKRMRPDRERGSARRERFRREARSAARLGHPNVVQIFDLVETDGGDWIVMEYVQGRPLSGLLRDAGPLPPGVAVDLARQIAEGLTAAHAQGLVHRDLKAENVMVTPAGQAKILDFGLARPLETGTGETLTDDGMVLGTYRSMSPEQAAGGTADARSDLFSLGVLLYEMLTGRSPFQGSSPLETLRKVTATSAEPLGRLRPDLPVDLLALVDSLLEKDPVRRPESAGQAVRDLRALAAGLEPVEGWTPPPPSTASGETETRMDEPIGMRSKGLGSSRSWTLTRRSGWIAGVLVALAVVAVLGAVFKGRVTLFDTPPLRVAVLRPVIEGKGREDIGLASTGVLTGIVRTLLSLKGTTVIEPPQIGAIEGGATKIAHAVGADEVLMTTVSAGDGATAYVAVRRVQASDGRILWTESFPVPTSTKDALVLSSGVEGALRRAYAHLELREGIPRLEVRAEDYADFLKVQGRLDQGRNAWAPELDHLEAITRNSPGFVDAYVQAAVLALNLYQDNKDRKFLDRARNLLERAHSLAPDYPYLVRAELMLALAEGNWQGAERLLVRLENLVPGDAMVLIERSRLAERRGRLSEAVQWMRETVERRPAWRDLLRLADLEYRGGQVDAARKDLNRVLELAPGNTWALAKLGELELLYGDLQRAEEIYTGLAQSKPQRSDLTNLGLVHFLLGRFEDAIEDYRRALEIEPGHLTVTLNLADAELALGRHAEAISHYGEVLAKLEERQKSLPLQPLERTMEGQCLVHLGKVAQAVGIALEVLQQNPEDSEVTYQAALIFALAGERASALALTRKALDLGVQRRWFEIPGFSSLREEPEFQRLIVSFQARRT